MDRLLERALERLHEGVGQVGDEAHRIAEQDLLPTRQLDGPGGGVEGGKELVLYEDAGSGEGIEQG